MTYYRAYRPRTFSTLLGQEAVSRTLQQALRQGRVGHAYLFSGPRGTGKTSTARIFAKALVCQNPRQEGDGYEPCDNCPSCQLVGSGQSPDILEIDAASNRGIEDIRQLRDSVQYRPLQLSRKVYIIDEVHMLTIEAFNALLKTLEEPPSYCLFILATTELHKVPATIRSRCQLLRFERGSVDAISRSLSQVAAQEGLTVDAATLALLAEHADGGFRDALTLLETLSTQHKDLTVEVSRQELGLADESDIRELITSCLSGQSQAALAILQRHLSTLPGSSERFATQLINEVRDRLYRQEGSLASLTQALGQLLEAYILLRTSPLPGLPLEIACLSICQYNDRRGIVATPDPAPVMRDVTPTPATAKKAEPTPALSVAPTPLPSASVPVVELSQEPIKDIRRAWKLMVEQVCRENVVLGQSLKQAVFHKAEDAGITIYVRYKFHAEKMNEKKNQARIKDLLKELTGQEWTVSYEVNASLPRHTPPKEIGTGLEDAVAVFGSPPST